MQRHIKVTTPVGVFHSKPQDLTPEQETAFKEGMKQLARGAKYIEFETDEGWALLPGTILENSVIELV